MSTRARYLRILSEGIRRYRKVLLPAIFMKMKVKKKIKNFYRKKQQI